MALIKLPGDRPEREVRLTIPAPWCSVCNDEVESWEVHYRPIPETDDEWVVLVYSCHGQQFEKQFRKSVLAQTEMRMAFQHEKEKAQRLLIDLARRSPQ